MPKIPPKKKNELCLRLIALSDLMLSTMDDLNITNGSPMPKEINLLVEHLTDVVDVAYTNKEAKSTTRLTKLIHKIDTVIRKEHEQAI
jgi:hypothetical protein